MPRPWSIVIKQGLIEASVSISPWSLLLLHFVPSPPRQEHAAAATSRGRQPLTETPIQVVFGLVNPSVPRNFPTPRSSSSDVPAAKLPKKHDDPWDYTSTNYPVTLPLRRPYSGDPDLDEDEFGQSSSTPAKPMMVD